MFNNLMLMWWSFLQVELMLCLSSYKDRAMKEFIGTLIRTARKNKAMTQEALAGQIELSVQAISNLERGETLPTIETLSKLSQTLDIPVQSFFQGNALSTPKRSKMEAEFLAEMQQLDDNSLAIALKQIRALSD
jgi:transcriptional regulator with XRE-family HTH domain